MLNVIGTVLEILGLTIAAVGMRHTWHEFAREPFLAPVSQRVGRLRLRLARLRDGLLTRLGRRPRGRTIHAGVAGAMAMVGSLRAREQYGRIGSTGNYAYAISVLEERTHELMDKLNDLRDHVDDELEKLQRDAQAYTADLAEALNRLHEQDRRVAVGGIRLEAVGLFLVALGVALQAIA